MIRVLHYVGKMNRGGMETFIMNLYRGVDRRMIQFDFAVHESGKGDFDEEIERLGGRIYRFPHMRENPIRYRRVWRDFWHTHKNEYKAFHVHTNSLANCIALEEAQKACVEIRIIHAHSSYANKGKLQRLNNYLHRRNQKRLSTLSTNLFACSDKAAEWMFGRANVEKGRIKFINNGVKLDEFSFSEQMRIQGRREFNIQDDTLVIGHIASFLPVKNHCFLVEVAREMKGVTENFVFFLVGDGPLKNYILTKVRENNLEKNFVFTGVRSDVNRLLSAFDVVVLPSLYEGMPVSMIEAQANGVSIVLSDTITKEVKLNNNVRFAPINSGAKIWANYILDSSKNHCSDTVRIKEAGFDIDEVCRYYEKLVVGGEK